MKNFTFIRGTSTLRPKQLRCCWRHLFVALFIVTTLLTGFTLTAQDMRGTVPVLTPVGGFGIDGDAFANTPTPGIGDWFYNPLYPGTGGGLFDPVTMTPLYPTMTYFLQDVWGAKDPTIFTSSNKINDNPSTYTWGIGMVPNKNEMQNVGVHFAYADPALPGGVAGDLWAIFASDRQVTNGEAYVDFEFLQKSLTMTDGGFATEGTQGGRTVGDLLVTVVYTNGGDVDTIEIRSWQPVTGGYEYVLQDNANYVGSIYVRTNHFVETVPFDVYGTTPGVYEPYQWVEGAINLTELLNFGANPCLHISTLFVRTKTSQSTTAELKDFPGLIQLDLGATELTVNCPDNVTLPACSTQADINAAFATWKTGFSYADGVPPITESYSYTGGAVIGSNINSLLPPDICGGTVSITYTVTDFCDQTESCTATFTVTPDEVAPVFESIPQNVTVQCIVDVPVMINLGWTDNCDGSGNVLGTDVSDGKTCPEIITRIWTYTDACGNPASAVQIITVDDNVAPVFAAEPQDVTVACIDDVPAMIELAWTDNCDGQGVVRGTDVSDGNTCPETITRTWTYTDACGNPASAVQIITVDDNVAPVITAPEDYTICNDPLPEYLNATWTDNCDAGGNLTAYGVPYKSDECSQTMSYTFTVTDVCGNMATKVVYVTREIETYGECETAFARYDDNNQCFIEDGFDRWGWTNKLSPSAEPYTLDLYAGAAQCNTSKGTKVGEVYVTYVNGKVTVEYDMIYGYSMSEAHIYIGCEPYPIIKGKQTVAPGQFTFNADNLDHSSGIIVSTPDNSVSGDIYVIAHAVTCELICKCTDPSNGEEPAMYNLDINLNCGTSSNGIDTSLNTAEANFKVFPVPFEETITVQYSFEYDTDVKIEVFNMRGMVIAKAIDNRYTKGEIGNTQMTLPRVNDQALIIRLTTNKHQLNKTVVAKSREQR